MVAVGLIDSECKLGKLFRATLTMNIGSTNQTTEALERFIGLLITKNVSMANKVMKGGRNCLHNFSIIVWTSLVVTESYCSGLDFRPQQTQ
jgi:hypothetical protein